MPERTGPKGPVPEGPAPPPAYVAPAAAPRLTARAAAQARRTGRTTVREPRVKATHDTRAASVVTRRDFEERLPRSAPDALRFEPGVYVQQTAHAQGSPYLRGMTGQQTVMMFDGVRLNNSTFRYGPNQYFFTIDSRTLQKIEVLRGAASTRYGSDAIGGTLLATPIEPSLEEGRRSWYGHSKAMLRTGTADGELGGRAQLDVGYKGKVGLFGGVGYRDVGLLRAGGKVLSPTTGAEVKSPLFAADGVTQRGTGFRELTADARLVWKINDKHRLTLGYYDYRQFDAPRTDRCPPVTAPQTECLWYEEQFRTLVYGAYDVQDGPAAAETVRWTVSYQNQHERRRYDRRNLQNELVYNTIGRDEVYSIGTGLQIASKELRLARGVSLKVNYGLDAYYDTIRSKGWAVFHDVGITTANRTQYTDRGGYLNSGLWTEARLSLHDRIELRAGGRAVFIVARAPDDPDPTARRKAIDQRWGAGVGGGGVALKLVDGVRWLVNLDQGFRAPNLDDMTGQQYTGAGLQYHNPNLKPERALSLETGLKVERPRLELAVFGFQSWVDRLIVKTPVDKTGPVPDPACLAGPCVELTNAPGISVIRGFEAAMRLFLPEGFGVRATLAYTWGDGPNPVPGLEPARVPLSRIPPLNGTAEVSWRHASGVFLGSALRWAGAQKRLTEADKNDQRIPLGGTPGFAVVDLRAGYRFQPYGLVTLAVENVANAAYRYHGSSVNGPGRSLNLLVELGF